MIESCALTAYGIGPTLYMSIIHPRVSEILSGTRPVAATMVLCLEDALAAADVECGMRRLADLLSRPIGICANHPRIFVRPRSYSMACRIRELSGIHQIGGFVVPKARVETFGQWVTLIGGSGLQLMPTIETPEFFDPARLVVLRDVFLTAGIDRIATVRIGGNDLLGSMGLRRVRGMTAYDGPLGWFLSMATSLLIPSGIAVAAPVFDIIDDADTLTREAQRDVEMGFVSKTAIHPSQVTIIRKAFAVDPLEFAAAREILQPNAPAVFRINDVMCEPSTHAAWARRTLARAQHFGVREGFCKAAPRPREATSVLCVPEAIALSAQAKQTSTTRPDTSLGLPATHSPISDLRRIDQ
jgi:citrate lyase beta subunit